MGAMHRHQSSRFFWGLLGVLALSCALPEFKKGDPDLSSAGTSGTSGNEGVSGSLAQSEQGGSNSGEAGGAGSEDGGALANAGTSQAGADSAGGSSSGGAAMGGSTQGGTGVGGSVETGGASMGGSTQGGSGVGGSTDTGGQSASGGDTAAGGTGGSVLPPTTDYTAPGPFDTTTDANVGPNGDCTVFRPDPLDENGFLYSPVVFGPGIGMQATQMEGFLLSIASHGFVIIGTGVLSGGPNDPNNLAAMRDALDWLLEQNDQSGIYQNKLDVTRAVSMGYSVGGTAAVELGGHEAVATTVSIHGHVATAALHGPLLQTSGTLDTVGRPMQQQTFDQSQVQTFFGTVTGADHGYIQNDNGGVERPAIIAWLRYWIYGDTGAASYFYGDDCVMCTDPWTDPQRKNWE